MVKDFVRAFTRLMRPLFGIAGTCRYTVTCSAYTRYAFYTYPPAKALWRAVCRLVRCNLFIGG